MFPIVLDLLPPLEPSLDLFFEASIGGLIVLSAGQRLRQAGHVRDRVTLVVRVAIVLAVIELLHQLRGCVAQVQWDGIGGLRVGVGGCGVVGGVLPQTPETAPQFA